MVGLDDRWPNMRVVKKIRKEMNNKGT